MLDFQAFLKSLRCSETVYNTEKEAFHKLARTENTDSTKFPYHELFLLNSLNFVNEEKNKRFIEIDIKNSADMISDFILPENVELFLVLSDVLIPIKEDFALLKCCISYQKCKLRAYFPKDTKTIEIKYICTMFTSSVRNLLQESVFCVGDILYESGFVNLEKLYEKFPTV